MMYLRVDRININIVLKRSVKAISDIVKSTLYIQRVVCILGMHRSGTSMITRVINLMGVFLGKTENMMPPNSNENAEGFWEHVKIMNIHEEILSELNSSWESTKPLPDEWWKLSNIVQYKAKLIDLVKEEFNNATIWGFKDPRTCIMLPLWKEIFEILGIEFMFVIPMRNPVDVANSIIKREGFSLNHSLRLWYYYMINILEQTKDCKRIFIQYDDMIENTDLNLGKLMNFLSIDISVENKKLIKASLKPNLRHSRTNQNELQLLECKSVVELYNICMKFIEDPYSDIDLKLHTCGFYKSYGDFMEVQYSDKKSEILITTLFIDYGMGYNDETSLKQRITINEKNEFNIDFKLEGKGENIKNIRWVLLEGRFCKCIIDKILVNNTNVKIETSNAEFYKGNQFDFLNINPMYFWQNHLDIVETVSVCGKIIFYEPFELQNFFQEKKVKVVTLKEKLNYYENENNLLSKEKDQVINENNLLIQERNRIIIENENNRLAREKEVIDTVNELGNKYKLLLDNKIQLDEQVQSIINSPSWRITKPLRIMKRVLFKAIRSMKLGILKLKSRKKMKNIK